MRHQPDYQGPGAGPERQWGADLSIARWGPPLLASHDARFRTLSGRRQVQTQVSRPTMGLPYGYAFFLKQPPYIGTDRTCRSLSQ